MCKFFRLFTLASLFALSTMSASVQAQSTTDGAIGGVVRDPQGAVIQNATVSVRNEETNQERTATTDSEGRFRVVQLQPGNYAVTISSSGFSDATQQAVVVEVGQVTSLEINLSVGGVTGENITVTGEAPVINTTQQDFSQNINQTSINELPINGRRWSNFAILTPGTVPDGTFGLISFRGISGLLNNNTVDGGDNNQAFFSEERGRTRISYVISQASIREFQVNTSNYSAEYGRSAGGVINAVTKSGTNEFHGSGFYYIRDNALGARNPFGFRPVLVNGVVTNEAFKPEDVRHQFGGNIGGPIVKDRLFFFFSYDQQRRNFPGLARFSSANVLEDSTSGNRLNRTLLRSRGLTDAQINSSVEFLVSLTGEVPRRGDQTLIFPKIDWIINGNNTFSASYNRLRWDSPNGIQTQATNTRARDNFGDDFVEVDSLIFRLQSTFTPTIINEARFQYGRDFETQFSREPVPNAPTTGVGGRSPQVFITNALSFGRPEFLERPSYPDERRVQFADTMTISRGNHTFKFGGDINRVRDTIDNLRFVGGQYNYTGTNGINDFIIDYTNFRFGLPATTQCASTTTRTVGRCYGGNYDQGFGDARLELTTTDFNLFFQDDWRATPRLTFNFGLRYEYQRLPDAVFANPRTDITVPNRNFTLAEATSNIPSDTNNFGPRVGFAYALTEDGRTSIRGGYGLYYGRIINATVYNALINTGVASGQTQLTLGSGTPVAQLPVFPNVFAAPPATGGTPAIGNIQYFAQDFGNPQIHQADFIIEREIARNTVVSASYLLSVGRKLPFFVDVNLSEPTVTRTFSVVGGPFDAQTFSIPAFGSAAALTRPLGAQGFNQAITEIQSSVRSQYNALVLQLNRRFTDGLQFQTNYTLSKATDTGQVSAAFPQANSPFNAFDLDLEDGTSNFDRRHKFTASVVWTPDFFGDQGDSRVGRAIFGGFTVAPIFQAYSGSPLNGFVGGSSLNRSNGANRFPLVERNAFRGPNLVNLDFRLSRRFRFGENTALEVLGEIFNVFNRTQVSSLNTVFYTVPNATSTVLTFNDAFLTTNEASSTLYRERQVQFAVRFEF